MSVKVCDRKQGKFETLTVAMELACHTIRICDNDKVFPKRHRLSVTADIIKNVKRIPKIINRANKKDLFKEYQQRLKLQQNAIDLIDDFEIDIQIAYLALQPNITEQKLDYWLKLLTETRAKLKSWIRADASDYKKFVSTNDNPKVSN